MRGGGLFKTIAVNQNPPLLYIGDFGRHSCRYSLKTIIKVDAIGIEGIADCTIVDGSVVEKKFNSTVNVAESENCVYMSLGCRRVNDVSKAITFNMQTTLDFIGRADTLCELFDNINFNSAERNTKIDISRFYEELVYEMNEFLNAHRGKHMLISFNISDFDKAAKERIRNMITCNRLAVDF